MASSPVSILAAASSAAGPEGAALAIVGATLTAPAARMEPRTARRERSSHKRDSRHRHEKDRRPGRHDADPEQDAGHLTGYGLDGLAEERRVVFRWGDGGWGGDCCWSLSPASIAAQSGCEASNSACDKLTGGYVLNGDGVVGVTGMLLLDHIAPVGLGPVLEREDNRR